MKLRVQELRWQSGNQLFQVQQFRDLDGAWVAVGDCHVQLDRAIAAAEAMLSPKQVAQPEEIIHPVDSRPYNGPVGNDSIRQ